MHADDANQDLRLFAAKILLIRRGRSDLVLGTQELPVRQFIHLELGLERRCQFLGFVRAKAGDLEAKWDKDISAIETRLREHPPKKGGVMFAGSSTIVRWDLDKYFPGKEYINVGFGG